MPDELVSKAKQSRSEKKARKAMSKLGEFLLEVSLAVQQQILVAAVTVLGFSGYGFISSSSLGRNIILEFCFLISLQNYGNYIGFIHY